jgi:peptidoglycan/xylan/chitin deacetylase (PgdA/CDA1 family)
MLKTLWIPNFLIRIIAKKYLCTLLTHQAPSSEVAFETYPSDSKSNFMTNDNEIYISLSFDDGWSSQYVAAKLILNKHNIKGTFYIITKFLESDDTKYMKSWQVKDLYCDGHEIGSHTVSHPNLYYSFIWNGIEVFESKKNLRELRVQVESFCYPFGRHNWFIRQLVKYAGYKNARTTYEKFNNPLYLSHYRIFGKSITKSTSIDEVTYWIEQAVNKKLWLVLVFHDIQDYPWKYGCTPRFLDQICQFLLSKNEIRVVPVSAAANVLMNVRKS